MTGEKGKTLRVAAVQMQSRNGVVEENLERATGFVEEAAKRGARLIVLPELMPTGYVYSSAMWDGAEPREGATVKWLRESSKRLGVWLGTSFLEAEGYHFFNTFVLTNPQGNEDGRVRKQTPALFESYFFRGARGSHLLVTDIGRIGVGICYENQLSYIPKEMHRESADLLLMPHSAPTPKPSLLFPPKSVDAFNRGLKELAPHYARTLGVPVVMINKSGPWRSPLPGLPFLAQDSAFPGLSAIVDSDGAVKAQLGDDEAVIVEDVTLDPSRKTSRLPECYGRWAVRQRIPVALPQTIEALGAAWYSLSRKRRRRARRISAAWDVQSPRND